ncbi:Uncharacterised protein [Chlamydia abortus]|nr:Uncharacterised protein [Chlamydia abortus]
MDIKRLEARCKCSISLIEVVELAGLRVNGTLIMNLLKVK